MSSALRERYFVNESVLWELFLQCVESLSFLLLKLCFYFIGRFTFTAVFLFPIACNSTALEGSIPVKAHCSNDANHF